MTEHTVDDELDREQRVKEEIESEEVPEETQEVATVQKPTNWLWDVSMEKQMALVKKTMLKNFTDEEVALTIQRARSVWANMLAGEFWAYKDSKGNLINIVSRPFLGKKAEENPEFDWIQSGNVFENDTFSMDIWTGEVNHKINSFKDRGNLLGAWAIAWRKNGKPICIIAERKDYDKNQYIWNSHKQAMMTKAAESIVLRKFARLWAEILGEWEYSQEDTEEKGKKSIKRPNLNQLK